MYTLATAIGMAPHAKAIIDKHIVEVNDELKARGIQNRFVLSIDGRKQTTYPTSRFIEEDLPGIIASYEAGSEVWVASHDPVTVTVKVGEEREILETTTYQNVVRQLIRVLGTGTDEYAASAWYVQYYERFSNAGISYHNFKMAFYERNNPRDIEVEH